MGVFDKVRMKYDDYARGQQEKKRQADIARAEAKVAADTNRLGPNGVLSREEAQRKEEVKLAIKEGKQLARQEYQAKFHAFQNEKKKLSFQEKVKRDAINRLRNSKRVQEIRPQYHQQYQQQPMQQQQQIQPRQFGGSARGLQIAGVNTRLQGPTNRPTSNGPQLGFLSGKSRIQFQMTRRLQYGRGIR